MGFVADLHLHSRYAMGTSRGLSLEALAWWASVKGIQTLACGDFTHPAWLAELKSSLRQTDDGLFDLQPPVELPAVKGHEGRARFVLGTEISCVYPQDGRSRRIHLLVLAPDFDAVDELCKAFSPYGSLDSDGRPTLRLAGGDAVEAVLSVSSECEVIVAHAWTPWYSVYGSKSGFDSLEDCFGPMAEHVHAIETGLSSDPSMNWRVPELSERTLVSFSDAHSARKMGREVTAFAGEPTYAGIVAGLRTGAVEWTAEFYPEEGKYYYDGHRKCGVRQHPSATLAQGERCPVCRRTLTLGVLHRMEALSSLPPADLGRDGDGMLRDSLGVRPSFRRLVPLEEVIAQAMGRGVGTKAVRNAYFDLIAGVGTELYVLTLAEPSEIAGAAGERVAEGVMRARLGQVSVHPGFDGEYGKVDLWAEDY